VLYEIGRVVIKAKAINGIAKTAKSEKGKATLASLVDHTLRLSKQEENIYHELIDNSSIFIDKELSKIMKDSKSGVVHNR